MCNWTEAGHVALFRHQECDGVHTFTVGQISPRGLRMSSSTPSSTTNAPMPPIQIISVIQMRKMPAVAA
jgi:hypothetical protein